MSEPNSVAYQSAQDVNVRLFRSDFLEFFTRIHPSVPVLLYLPLIAYYLFQNAHLPWTRFSLFLAAGVLTWSLTEYFLHRFLFHFSPRGATAKRMIFLIHGIHHDYPSDSKRLVMPPVISVPIAAILLFFFLGTPGKEVFLCGFGIGYLLYDLTHYAVHHFNWKGPVFLRLKRHHLRHHFQDAEHGFGVSSPLWDYFFRTGFSASLPSGRSFFIAASVIAAASLYCLTHYWMGHLKPIHFFFSAVVLALFFTHAQTRIFLLLALPFVFKDIFFDALRYVPFEWLNIHVTEPYHIDRLLFGIPTAAGILLPHEWIFQFARPLFDILAGIVYTLNEPVAILSILLLWRGKSSDLAQRYAAAFLVMNLFADLTYVFYPAAAPWYVAKFGFLHPLQPVPGDPAGLTRFDEALGFQFMGHFYGMSPVVFGAIPSMHAGFSVLAWIYSFRVGKVWAFLFGLYTAWMCAAALYLQHHYAIDLWIGALYAGLAALLVEGPLLKGVRKAYGFLFKNLDERALRPLFGKRP